MSVRAAYDAWSRSYDVDENRTRDLDAVALRRTLGGPRVKAALELGCGTGKNTSFLARRAKSLLALDFSEGMLARARAKVRAKNVEFRRADLSRPWPVADGVIDLAACDLVLEHIADLRPFFRRASRALRRGGVLFVCELHPCRQYLGAQANFRGRKVAAFAHDLGDFLDAAERAGLRLADLREWRHAKDRGKPPRLVSFVFLRP